MRAARRERSTRVKGIYHFSCRYLLVFADQGLDLSKLLVNSLLKLNKFELLEAELVLQVPNDALVGVYLFNVVDNLCLVL